MKLPLLGEIKPFFLLLLRVLVAKDSFQVSLTELINNIFTLRFEFTFDLMHINLGTNLDPISKKSDSALDLQVSLAVHERVNAHLFLLTLKIRWQLFYLIVVIFRSLLFLI